MKNKTRLKQLLLLLFVFTFSAASAFGQDCGDVDGNGFTDIVDALLVGQFYVNLNPFPFNEDVADVNCDEQIDIIDALLIAQFYVGLIDTLDCCDPPIPTPGGDVTLEMQAEDAAWSSGSVDTNFDGYTGTGFVNTDNAEGAWIEWSVEVDRDCDAVCIFRYAVSDSDRPMDLSVNGIVQKMLSFSATSAWNDWQTETVNVNLTAGSNEIRVTATSSGGAPNMDKMDIISELLSPSPTPPPTPTPTLPSFSHTYFHKNILIVVKNSEPIDCDDLVNHLEDELLGTWDKYSGQIDTIKQVIAGGDSAKIAAIDTAEDFIDKNWTHISSKMRSEIATISSPYEQDCHYFCFRQDKNNYTTYVFLDLYDNDFNLFEGKNFAFYIFVLAMQLWVQGGYVQNHPHASPTPPPPPRTMYIDQISPDWITTSHNMIIGSPGGEALECANTTTFLIKDGNETPQRASTFLDAEVAKATTPPSASDVHVYVLDTLPFIYTDESLYDDHDDSINTTISEIESSHPIKQLFTTLPPYENDLFKRIDSFPTCDDYCQPSRCMNCQADIFIPDDDYDTPIPDHGIFIAGLIKSIAPDATIEILETLSSAGVGSMKSFLCALNYIHKNMNTNKKNIINCSFGLKCSFVKPETYYEEMVADPDSVGLLVVMLLEPLMELFSDTTVFASTGNHDGDESAYPAALDLAHVIGVGSLDIEGVGTNSLKYTRASYSNTTKRTNPETEEVEVKAGFYAPGGMIIDPSADFPDRVTCKKKGLVGAYIGDNPANVSGFWCGTSFAAPLVAGVFANLYRKYDREEVKGILRDLEGNLIDYNLEFDEFFNDPDDTFNDIIAVPIIQQHLYDNRFCEEGECPDE